MTMRLGRLIAPYSLGLLLVCNSVAQTTLPAEETLTEAWSMALANDRIVAAVDADLEAAQAAERAARAARFPRLETTASYARYTEAPSLELVTPVFAFRSPVIFDDNDTVLASAQLSLPLFTGGTLSAGISASKDNRRAAEASRVQVLADLKLDVASRYITLLRAERTLSAAAAAAESLSAHVRDVEAMLERDLVARSDLLAARVTFANAEQQRLKAENTLQLARALYNRRLGEPLNRAAKLSSLPDNGTLDGRSIDELIEISQRNRPETTILAAQARALGAQARAERGKLLPQVALVGRYDHLETTILDREDFTSVGVGVRWTMFDGGQTRQRARALQRQGKAVELRLADLRSLLEVEVQEALLAIVEADARRAVARAAVAEADENLRISRELYGAGLATNTLVLEAVTLQESASGNRDDASFDAQFSRLRLAHAIGEL